MLVRAGQFGKREGCADAVNQLARCRHFFDATADVCECHLIQQINEDEMEAHVAGAPSRLGHGY